MNAQNLKDSTYKKSQSLNDVNITAKKISSFLKRQDATTKLDITFINTLPKILGNTDPIHYLQTMQDFGIPLLTGVIPILALLAMTMILSVMTMKSIRFRALLCGRPSVVIRRGEIDQGEMRRNRLTVDELLEELRSQGYTGPQKVEYAILETNGQLSVLPWAAEKPPTLEQLGLEAQESGLPLVLISDGRLLERNLRVRGYDGHWLDKQLEQRGLKSWEEVFLMTVDEQGQIYLAPREREGRRGA